MALDITRGLVTINVWWKFLCFWFYKQYWDTESLSVLDCCVAPPCAVWSLTTFTLKHKSQKSFFIANSLLPIYKTSSVTTICMRMPSKPPKFYFKIISTTQKSLPKRPFLPASTNSLHSSSWFVFQIPCKKDGQPPFTPIQLLSSPPKHPPPHTSPHTLLARNALSVVQK